MRSHPAFFRTVTCEEAFWSSVETRAYPISIAQWYRHPNR